MSYKNNLLKLIRLVFTFVRTGYAQRWNLIVLKSRLNAT